MIPFSPPHIDDKTIAAVVEVLRSGWITTGPKTKAFEKALAAYCGLEHVLCVSSATTGMELMLHWFGVEPGDEVIVPAYTYTATASVVVHCGAIPVMVDVGQDFLIDVEQIRRAITRKTKVIMPVDIAGYPCDYDQINALVRTPEIQRLFTPHHENQKRLNRILIMADAAHSLGAYYRRKRTGSLADVSVFSFHAVKNLTTAEGGAVCLNLPEPFDNAELYKYLCHYSLHGQSKDALAKTQSGNWRYDVLETGYKCNMTDMAAAMGLVEIERYDRVVLARRKQIFETYTQNLKSDDRFQVPEYKSDHKETSYHAYLLRIRDIDEARRDAIIQKIFTQGVSVNVHFIPLPMLTGYKLKGYNITQYPTAYNNYAREISLPVYVDLSDENVETVIAAVKKAVEI